MELFYYRSKEKIVETISRTTRNRAVFRNYKACGKLKFARHFPQNAIKRLVFCINRAILNETKVCHQINVIK